MHAYVDPAGLFVHASVVIVEVHSVVLPWIGVPKHTVYVSGPRTVLLLQTVAGPNCGRATVNPQPLKPQAQNLATPSTYLDLQSTTNDGPYTLDFGIKAAILGTLEVQKHLKLP